MPQVIEGIELKEVSEKIKSFDSVVTRILKLDPVKVADIGKKDLIDDTINRGWRRFKFAIDTAPIDDDTAKIFINDSKHEPLANMASPITPSQLATFLRFGTSDHIVKPVTAKALHWTGGVVSSKGLSAGMKKGDFFSKGHKVRGIKATNFWKLLEISRGKINKYVGDWIKKAGQ